MTCPICHGQKPKYANANDPNECRCLTCQQCGKKNLDPWDHGGMELCDECLEASEKIIDDINDELERLRAEISPNTPLYAYRDEHENIGVTTDADGFPTAYVDCLRYLEALRQFEDGAGLGAAWDAVYLASMTCVEIGDIK